MMSANVASPTTVAHSCLESLRQGTPAERIEAGRAQRQQTPRSAHAEWRPSAQRDVLALLKRSNVGRVETLIPLRHARMLVSPFTFYRATAALMAHDLACTPNSGLVVQLCGDCHVSNFGLFGSPERRLVFDINDFDETLPGPFEWDLKRLAASLVVAARNAELTEDNARAAVRMAARAYRESMHEFAATGYLDIWYARTESDAFLQLVEKRHRKTAQAQLARVQTRDRLHAFDRLTETVDGARRIINDPPLVVRLHKSEADVRTWLTALLTAYYDALDESRKRLLARYRLVDVAHKVVGVGSVGKRCFISYWEGNGECDPLFLQVKQTDASVLEPYLGRSEYDQPGQRVVVGQRLLQATGDIFLARAHSEGQDYLVRQLYDMKGSADLEKMPAVYLRRYAALCGAVLARGHARSGDSAEIAGYLGKSDRFDEALVAFATRYADQNDADYAVFKQAAADGAIVVQPTTAAARRGK